MKKKPAVSVPKKLTDAQLQELASVLLGTYDSVYVQAEALFGLEPTEALFEQLAQAGVFRCTHCGKWKQILFRSTSLDVCQKCQNS